MARWMGPTGPVRRDVPCICLGPACVVGTLHAFPTHTLLQGEAGGLDPRNIHCLRKRGRRPLAKTKVGHATCQSCCRLDWLDFILFASTFLCGFTYVSPSSRLVRFSLWKPWLHAKKEAVGVRLPQASYAQCSIRDSRVCKAKEPHHGIETIQ